MNTSFLRARSLSAGLAVLAALLAAPAVAVADETPAATSATGTASTTSTTDTTSATDTAGTTDPTGTTSPSPTGSVDAATATSPTASDTSAPNGTPVDTAASDPTFTVVPIGSYELQQAGYAGGFLARQLAAAGDRFSYPGTTYFDGGLTIDAILGLDGAGVGKSQAGESTAYLAAHVGDYIGSFGELYVGGTAKTLVAAEAQGVDATSFGGVDLVSSLQSLLTPSGRFSDKSAYGDYSNAFGQSFAIIGLKRAGVAVPGSAVSFLITQQCADGGFKLSPDDAGCSSDTDATALAVQAVIAAKGPSDAAAVKGLDFLKGRQAASGGLAGTGPTAVLNANTTALAAQAFAAGGLGNELLKAQTYLEGLQYGCAFPSGLRGGIAYDAASFASQKKAGSKAKVTDQDIRSTAQATLGLSGQWLLTVTSTDAKADAPTLDCPTTTPTNTDTSSSTSPVPGGLGGSGGSGSGGGSGASGGSGTSPAGTVANGSTPGGPLAFTGANLLGPVLLGALLVLVGGFAIVVGRRRGRHA
jgi:hypothetical protein